MAPKKSIKHANSNLPVRVTQGSVSITRHSAIFMEGDGDPLISPSSCSQVLDAIVTHPKNHTQNSLNALWSRGLNLSTAKQDWKKKFLIQGFSEAVTEEVVCWIFFSSLAPLRVQSSMLTAAKATVTFAENQTTDPSTENTIWEPVLLAHDAVPRS